ncbi:two-component sensor histidine kinase [Betaproteobacteria bacterium]|nr:two-component sensor histidine kinase [Betaproteobacteria bacterium]
MAAITLLIFSVIACLGFRAIEHEALLRVYQSQTLAQTRTAQAEDFVMNLLRQKATRLDAIMGFLQFDEEPVRSLLEKDVDIDDVFVLQKNTLSYPDEQKPLTQKEKTWIQTITPLLRDPSLLYSHSEKTEKGIPRSGWFVINETQEPILIYWNRENDRIVGFHVSYIKLLSDVLNAADFNFAEDTLIFKESGRILYQSPSDLSIENRQPRYSMYLPYPLNTWSLEYYGQKTDTLAVYLWGGVFLLALLMTVGLIIFRLYREYTQTARLARQQVNFVSQVSHELKTPLTNISLYAELLKEELGEFYEDGVRRVDVIISESQRLSRLIQNILTFSHAPKIHIQPVDIGQLMARIVQTFTPSSQARGMILSLNMGESVTESVMIDSNLDLLTQILGNFLSNAEKYASSGQRVDLTVESHPDYLDIHVRDYGPGIPEKEAKKIFQPFYRIQSTITEGVTGTGIGLTIARQLAESLHAEILLAHPSPGMQFTLRLKKQPRIDNPL